MYNPDDWNIGDLVIMELDLSRVTASDDSKRRNSGRQLRMLINRDVGLGGPRRNFHDMWQGSRGAIKKVLRDPGAVVYIERVFPVDQPTLNRLNQSEVLAAQQSAGMLYIPDLTATTVVGTNMTITRGRNSAGS